MGKKMTTSKKKASKKVAAKVATTKKAATTNTVKKKAVKKAAVKKASPRSSKIKVTPEQHHKMICEAAYYTSLNRTSETVNPAEDWFQAEAAINKICIVQSK